MILCSYWNNTSKTRWWICFSKSLLQLIFSLNGNYVSRHDVAMDSQFALVMADFYMEYSKKQHWELCGTRWRSAFDMQIIHLWYGHTGKMNFRNFSCSSTVSIRILNLLWTWRTAHCHFWMHWWTGIQMEHWATQYIGNQLTLTSTSMLSSTIMWQKKAILSTLIGQAKTICDPGSLEGKMYHVRESF